MSFYNKGKILSQNLSKSLYCMGVQCPKMLWLKKHKPEEQDLAVMNQAVLDTGNEVGDLAMGLLGDFKEVPFGDLSQMIIDTQKMMDDGVPVIAEASFAYEGCFCSVDILKNLGDGKVELYEVKSSTELHEIYIHDASYQRYVLTKLGYDVQKTCLVHLNNEYVRHGELELEKLFKINDISKETEELYPEVEKRIESLKQCIASEEEPERDLGTHCADPYDCSYFRYCTRNLPSPNVFDVSGMQFRTKIKNYSKGAVSFCDLEKEKLNPKFLLQIQHELYSLPDHLEADKVKAFMDTLTYPLYFLDFETFNPAIPLFDNSSPYEQIPFQYSLHYIESCDGELLHKEYLAYPGKDPRRELAENLCKDIPENVCTMAYNMSFEKTCIKKLAALFPDLEEHLMNIYDHIVDLMVPFREKSYYTKAMQGSYSIKYVLPALFPNDPELDYHNLDEIHNGAEASATFMHMAEMIPDDLEATRKNMLKYCGLDTYAMVKIWQKLGQII